MYRRMFRALPLGLTAAFLPLALAQAAMHIPGQLSVNATGAATYTVPLQVPPGTAGLQPMLALAYSSQAGNGIAGMGWSLGGQSTVTRCPQTMAQDGVRGSINFDGNDRFCLDGQRLIAVNGTNGANGTEYRTELESVAKVISYGVTGNGPQWFKVWTKSGLVLEYGNTNDSRVIATGKATASLWAQNRQQDVKGNYLTTTYTRDVDYGDVVPSRIDYTGNATTGTAPNAAVQFQYLARPDSTLGFQAGSRYQNRFILSRVQTYSGSTMVKDYRLGYDVSPATKRSRLVSLFECDGGGTCLPSTAFKWQAEPAATFTLAATSVVGGADSAGWIDGTRLFTADVNGDGKSDFIARSPDGTVTAHISNGSTFSGTASALGLSDAAGYNDPLKFFVADVNGDGKTDIVARSADGIVRTYLSNGSTFALAGEAALGFADAGGWGSGTRYFLIDVNGDGRTDLVARYASGNLMTYLSNGTTFVQSQLSVVDQTDASGWGTGLRYFTMDVNGDGKTDLVARNGAGDFLTFLSNGTNFVYAGVSPLGLTDAIGWNSGLRFFVLDINGDGLMDIAARDSQGNFTSYLSNGTTFVSAGVSWFPGYTDAGGWNSGQRFYVMDVNGDGLTDIVGRYGDGRLEVFASNGIGFASAGVTATELADAGGWNNGVRYFTADVNGDGKSDLIARGASGDMRVYQPNTVAPDLMVWVINGMYQGENVKYQALSDSSGVYVKDNNAVYPLQDAQPAMYVVSSIANANGIGEQIVTNYTYGGLKVDTAGRGSLGFRWIKAVQQDTGVTTQTENRQDWPYVGMPAQVTTSLAGSGNAGVLRRVVNSYGCTGGDGGACVVNPGARYFPSLSGLNESNWDLNGALLSVTTRGWQYDLFGNVTQTTMSSNDGYSERTDNTYTNDVPNWRLGQLTRSVTSKQTP
jgi:hypothetical protein